MAGSKSAIEESNAQLVRKLDDKDLLILDEGNAITGADGRAIVRKAREESVEVRLDGQYKILSVQSGSLKSGFKASVENVDTSEILSVDIPDGTLSVEQLNSLQQGEWGKETILMKINASKRGDKILRATLTHAGISRRP